MFQEFEIKSFREEEEMRYSLMVLDDVIGMTVDNNFSKNICIFRQDCQINVGVKTSDFLAQY